MFEEVDYSNVYKFYYVAFRVCYGIVWVNYDRMVDKLLSYESLLESVCVGLKPNTLVCKFSKVDSGLKFPNRSPFFILYIL